VLDYTVSSRYIDPKAYDLSQFEMSAMSSVRDLVQRLYDSSPLLAAADPAEMVTEQMVDEYLSLAETLWYRLDVVSDGFGLDLLPLATFQPLVDDAIRASKWRFMDVMRAVFSGGVGGALQGEFLLAPDYVPGTGTKPPAPYLVQYGDIRPIMEALGGGGSDSEVPLSSGLTSGRVFKDVLDANGISSDEKIWLYGPITRREFNGHRQMDGLVFTSWTDPALEVAPQDRWLRTTHYRVGDHWGCACVVVPFVPNFGDEFAINLTAAGGCQSATCAPPPVGTGGSSPSSGGWAEHKSRITSLDSETIESVAGKGIDRMFIPGGSGVRAAPWPRAPRSKTGRLYDPDLVRNELKKPPKLEEVDPRLLYSTQPSILRTHVAYYMGDEYKRTGRTSADQDNAGNAFPTIYVNKKGQHLILSGHHRAAAALAKGEALEARIIRE
jgi:hypothetical protein